MTKKAEFKEVHFDKETDLPLCTDCKDEGIDVPMHRNKIPNVPYMCWYKCPRCSARMYT